MKVIIIGAGALGSVLGGLLHEAGADVVFLERDLEEVRHIQEQGLWLEGVSGERLIRPAIAADPSEIRNADLALVVVKSYDTASTIPALQKILASDGVVLTLQNGIGNYETLESGLPGRVLLGTTTMGAMTLGRGRFRHTGFGDTHLGEADGSIRERTRKVVELLATMNGGPVHVVNNAMGSVWSKLIVNAGINAPCTLLRVRNGDLPSTAAGIELIHDVVRECLAVVEAKGIKLILDDPEGRVIAVCHGTAGNLNSMFQDILAGRGTEIDYINGAVAREAEGLGLEAPVNRTLAQLIKALEGTADKRVQ